MSSATPADDPLPVSADHFLSIEPNEITVNDLREGHLSQSKLRQLAGEHNLEAVTRLEVAVDVNVTSLSDLGRTLPALQQLKLSNSRIPSIRDIGSGYRNLRVLWLTHCKLEELDGIGSLSQLKELYVAYNSISDLSSLSTAESIEILDLEGNLIGDFEQVEHLSFCPALQMLTLETNPLTTVPEGEDTDVWMSAFRKRVHSLIPHLQILDDISFFQAKADEQVRQPKSQMPSAEEDSSPTAQMAEQSTSISSPLIESKEPDRVARPSDRVLSIRYRRSRSLKPILDVATSPNAASLLDLSEPREAKSSSILPHIPIRITPRPPSAQGDILIISQQTIPIHAQPPPPKNSLAKSFRRKEFPPILTPIK